MDGDPIRVLLIEDNPGDAALIRRMLASLPATNPYAPSFELRTAGRLAAGLALLAETPTDVVLLDLSLPDSQGLDTLTRVHEHAPALPIVLLTGLDDEETAIMALRRGAQDYLVKSKVDEELLTRSTRYAIERKRAERELRESFEMLRQAMEGTVCALAATAEMRDPYTAGHQRRVSRLACAVAAKLALPTPEIEGLRMAGTIHDIGKIGVPAEILSKPGQLSKTEFNIIKTHPAAGHELLKGIAFPQPVARIVLQHHERVDGSGYPSGLQDGEILLEARILAVADVVEAMTSYRPYRPALGLGAALHEISANRGRIYDADAVDACIEVLSAGEFEL